MTLNKIFENIFGTEPKFMVRATDPVTSMDAAESIDSTKLEQMVYDVVAMYPNGCTSDDVLKHFPHHGVQTISPRFAPLIRKGFIEDTGEKRKASSGRSQRVMKAIVRD